MVIHIQKRVKETVLDTEENDTFNSIISEQMVLNKNIPFLS